MQSLTKDMTKGAPLKIILTFAVPMLIGNLFQQVYNLVDTMIAGNVLGDDAIAAIGAVSVIYSLLMNFAVGLNDGCCIMLSQHFGADDIRKFKQGVSAMVILDLSIGTILTIVPALFLKPLMRALETPDKIFDQAYTYIIIIFFGTLATICYNMCSGFLRAVGNSKTPLCFLMISSVLNVVLDILLVIVIPCGIAGTAIATVISQVISSVLSIAYIAKHYRSYLPGKEELHPELSVVAGMVSTGLSMGLMQAGYSLGSVLLQRAINALDTPIITAHTASRRTIELLMIPMATIASANATFVGQNYGAGRYDRIRQSNKQMFLLEFAWSAFSILVSFAFGKTIIRLLTGSDSAYVTDNAMLNLKMAVLFYFSLGILLVLRTSMQAMGHRVLPVLASVIELVGKIIAAFWVVPVKGYFGVALTEPIIWVLCALFLGSFYLTIGRQRKAVLCHAPAA